MKVTNDMIKVKNKRVVSEVARITYRGNKKRNCLTILAICLTAFLITVVIALGMSYWNTISTRMIRMNGMDYDIELSEPDEEQVAQVRSMDGVREAGIEVKCGIVESYEGKQLDKIRLYWLDEVCWEKICIPALEFYEGNYPQKEDEIMISNSALKAMGIKNPVPGMKLTLSYYTLEEGDTGDILKKEFSLSGFYADYSGSDCIYVSKEFFEGAGVKQTDFTQGALKIALKNPLYSESDIISMQNQLNLYNAQVISADYDTISNFYKMVLGLAVFLIMIFISGYLFIYNTLYISIAKDIRYYGQLKTIGMTSVQLRAMVYKQAVWNSLFGIPVGLAAGMITANGVIPQIIHIVNPSLKTGQIADAPYWIYIIAAVFAFAVNITGSQKPAKMAAHSSPIEALTYLPSKKIRRKQRRESGGPGKMAFENMFRDKKQAFVILLSFVIAVSVFFIANTVIKENDAKTVLNAIYSYDIRLINQTMLEDRVPLLSEERINQINAIDGVKSVGRVTSDKVIIPYQEEVLGQYFKDLYESRYTPGNYEEDMAVYKKNPESDLFAPRFIGIDEEEFAKLNEDLSGALDQEEFDQGEIAVACNFFMNGADEGMTGKTVSFYFPDDDTRYTAKIAGVIKTHPAHFAGGCAPDLIVSEKFAEKILGNTVTELIKITYDESFSESVEDAVLAVFKDEKQVSYESKLERYDEMKKSEIQVKVLGNSLGIIMALLSLLNYYNMMAASIHNRSKEFAVLESIGMTSKQLKRVLAYEGLGYGVISVLVSLMAGIPISVWVFQSMNLYGVHYIFPWVSNLLLIAAVLVLCTFTPILIYQKTQKESIVERLRRAED